MTGKPRQSRRPSSSILFSIAAALVGSHASSHHASVVEYDHGRTETIRGNVTGLELVNPHTLVYLDVLNENGETEQWVIEGPGKLSLARRGWTDDTVTSGDTVTATGHPTHSGRKAMWLERIVLPDGREFLDPAYEDELAIEAQRRERVRQQNP